MIYLEDGSVVPVEKSELPIELPVDIDLKSSGNPLENHPNWKKTSHKKPVENQRLEENRYVRYFCRFFVVFFGVLFARS